MTKGDRQPISVLTLRVTGDAFWNWLADEVQIDLSDLELVGSQEVAGGDVEIVVRRREKVFDQAAIEAAFKDAQVTGDENDRFFREG